MLLAFVGLFGCGFSDFAAAQNAIGGPKKPAVVGGPVKQTVIGGPAKQGSPVVTAKVVTANRSAPVAVSSAPQVKCTGRCDVKGLHR